ncbi:MAG: hypothetical protein Q8R98_22900 [Rubrivivax sp.]|nr:hypothetical protein [Rubrivivax sp.]MDP3614700.1 hypothetical protein [Rubrivivax sp.]
MRITFPTLPPAPASVQACGAPPRGPVDRPPLFTWFHRSDGLFEHDGPTDLERHGTVTQSGFTPLWDEARRRWVFARITVDLDQG